MKRCIRTVWKTMLVLFSTFSCLLQGMGRFSRKCVAIVNHKRVVYWVNNYTKMKYMLEKHDAWCGAMVCDAEHPTIIPMYTTTTPHAPRGNTMRPRLYAIGRKVDSLLSEPSLSTHETWQLPQTYVLLKVHYLD